ncbi:MAG: hypothetical protein HY279_09190 [Nitrospinae bacterium]|nr:hypothetical protein [Nitrospinota bacterium]
MIKRQRENLAKYCYDMSKIMFAALVLGNIMSERFSPLGFWLGIIETVLFLILGYLLDKGENHE